MSEYIVELDSKHSIALGLAFVEEMRGGDFVRGEIVRCRDCKYMFDWAYDRMLCKMWADGGMDDDAKSVLYPTVNPDGFCAWGERKANAQPSRQRGEGES